MTPGARAMAEAMRACGRRAERLGTIDNMLLDRYFRLRTSPPDWDVALALGGFAIVYGRKALESDLPDDLRAAALAFYFGADVIEERDGSL